MKTAIVTGASTGIGRAVAQELAQHDYRVILVARNLPALSETKRTIEQNNGKAEIFTTDLASVDSVNKLIASITSRYTEIHLIANIAGIWHGSDEVYAGKDFEDFDQNIILNTYQVGTITPTLLIHGLLPHMKACSKVINLSGTFENGAKGWLPYFVSKRAIEDLTLGLAQELEEKDIQVNCISPSDTATEAYAKFFPQYMNDAIEPSEIAKKIVDLAREDNNTTGKIFVMKKGSEPYEHFHY